MPDWQSCANRHLLAHLMKQGGKRVYYCHPDDTRRMGPAPTPHPLTVKLSEIIRSHAHCWALDMADWPGGPPTAQEQRASWERAMEAMDRECRQAREGWAGVDSH